VGETGVIAGVLVLYSAAVVSPGANPALVSRLAMSGQPRAAIAAACGIAMASTFYATLTMSGLGVALRAPWVALGLQLTGGTYLIYLGARAWTQAPARRPAVADPVADPANDGLVSGLLVNLSNPNTIAFFVSLYAAAVPVDTPAWARAVIVVGGLGVELSWYGTLMLALSRPGPQAIYRRHSLWIERAVGLLFLGFGVLLILRRLRGGA
jgi:threonine/homoserine/homoserine lactone efflux protein